MEQIILNLAINARDAMPLGGRLTLATKNLLLETPSGPPGPNPAPSRYVVLTVSDTGSGMTPEVMDHIFEPFFTTKEIGKGTGLGLSVVFGIVSQSVGTINVFSEPGKGTVFTLFFPETASQSVDPERAQPSTSPDSKRGSETLLLVEDEGLVRKFASQALQSQGYTVIEAVNGMDALETIARKQGPLHMIITYVVMPDLGGPAFVERIRQEYPALPILFISGFTESTAIQNGMIGKSELFLQKPFSPDELARKVREALDLTGLGQKGMREYSGDPFQ